MAKTILNEAFSYNVEKRNGKNGEFYVIFIDPKLSETTYPYKDKIKDFGAKWDSYKKTWYWYASNDPQTVIRNQVKPCVEYLTSVESVSEGTPNEESDKRARVLAIIDKIMSQLNIAKVESDSSDSEEPAMSKSEVMAKLQEFKKDLLSIVSDKEFKKKLEPIIKFRQAQGHVYSFKNALLIMIQDPNASMVKSKTNWAAMNREVIPGSKGIILFRPTGGTEMTPQEKALVKARLLKTFGAKSVEELNPGQKEELRIRMNSRKSPTGTMAYYAFDVRNTKQIEGKEDVVGDGKVDLPWYDDSGEETPRTRAIFDALIDSIQSLSINVSYAGKDVLGGARGVAKSDGTITILTGVPKNAGLLSTITHEFAHHLLHLHYVKDKHPEFSDSFRGTLEGRGPVEQQAELSAWIVLRNFGYDAPTNINYMGMWGVDEKNASKAFDAVAQTAQRIITMIGSRLDKNKANMKESVELNENASQLTGLDVARMVGMEDVYLKSQQELEDERKEIAESFKNTFKRIFG